MAFDGVLEAIPSSPTLPLPLSTRSFELTASHQELPLRPPPSPLARVADRQAEDGGRETLQRDGCGWGVGRHEGGRSLASSRPPLHEATPAQSHPSSRLPLHEATLNMLSPPGSTASAHALVEQAKAALSSERAPMVMRSTRQLLGEAF